MLNLFGAKPDHQMYNLAEARRLLDELPQDKPHKALNDITFWLVSIKDTPGFRPETRAAIIMLMDETAQPLQAELLNQYLSEPRLQDFQGLRLWQCLHAFSKALAGAYTECINEYRQTNIRKNNEQMALLCVRLLHAAAEQMKLELMRYIEVDTSVWQTLCTCYSFAESGQYADTMVIAYPGQIIRTSPQRELLRALVLHISSPETLAGDQIEMSYRITGRMADFFDFKTAADSTCPYQFSLLANAPPQRAKSGQHATPGMRFFGAARALPAVIAIIDQNGTDPVWQERRLTSEYTPAGKLTLLKHLLTYWAQEPPRRHQERSDISTSIEVTHGFRVISQLVTHIDPGYLADAAQKDMPKKEGIKLTLATNESIDYTAESWTISDVSIGGIGATLSKNMGAWVKIGNLCGIRPQNDQPWWVGMVRRLRTDTGGTIDAGIEILAKKPASIWLRALGKDAEKASNWETSSGSFKYNYLPAILLPDKHNSYLNATILMESGSYVRGNIYHAMMEENSRDLKLTRLIAEGEDYEQIGFEWLPGHDA
jgi:hypothetical protein